MSTPILLWHGFEHAWLQNNHRLHRLGSWLKDANTVGHSGASGASSDKLTFCDFALGLRVEGLAATYGSVSLELKGTRGVAKDFQKVLSIQKFSNQVGVPMLAGFDLNSLPDGTANVVCSAKLRELTLAVEGDGPDGASQTSINVHGTLNLDCKSAECCGGDGWHYQLTVYYVVLTATSGEMAWAPGSMVGNNYSFNRAAELSETALPAQVVTLGGMLPLYASGIRGIQLIANRDQPQGLRAATIAEGVEITKSVTLGRDDTAMHLLEWNLGMKNAAAVRGGMSYTPSLYFKNWKPGMSLTNYRDGGTASIAFVPVNLAFTRGGTAKSIQRSGTLLWVGGNQLSTGADGVNEVKVNSPV